LLSPERFRRLPPRKILRRVGLKKDDTFVDIGCGTGFFSLPAAALVGQGGAVYSLDISPRMLDDLVAAARREGILNLKAILSTESGRELPRGASHYFMANVFHELDDKKAYLGLLHRRLGPESRLAIVDYHKRRTEHGPPVAHRISRRQAGILLASAGFRLVDAFEVNSEEYGLVAKKDVAREAA
jgi:ubiquinone/menaquinone biosynthesis C-methylase UbiE